MDGGRQIARRRVDGELFAPVDRFEIYSYLGRCYAFAGRAADAVELYERCIEGVGEAGGDPALEARYATLLSYALSDMGELTRAEDVVAHALARLDETHDPYMRVRLYWSMARLAHTEGRSTVALNNVRKAIALLQATDDTLHLARAHILASSITLTREDADRAEMHLNKAEVLSLRRRPRPTSSRSPFSAHASPCCATTERRHSFLHARRSS